MNKKIKIYIVILISNKKVNVQKGTVIYNFNSIKNII